MTKKYHATATVHNDIIQWHTLPAVFMFKMQPAQNTIIDTQAEVYKQRASVIGHSVND